MKLVGLWWNPEKDGEGFVFTEDTDPETGEPRIIGYYYTYIGRTPVWYMLDLRWDGDTTLSGDVIATSAESTSEPGSPGKFTEERVGGCTLTARGDDTWDISITINTKSVDYQIGSLFGTGLPAWQPEPGPDPDPPPDPDPDPPPANPFEGKLTFRIKPFKHPSWLGGSFMQSPDGTWFLIWSKPQIPWGNLATGKNTMFQLKITALENLSLSANAHGYGSPNWEGVPSTIAAGSPPVEMKCVLTKGARPSSSADADYQLNINGMKAVLLTEHITQSL